jgi:Lipocalin-like domain
MRSFQFVFAFLAIVLASACTPEVTPTNTALLTSKTWMLTGLTIDPALPYNTGGAAVSNWYAQMSLCSKDDTYKFNNGGNYGFEEGATKCSANDPTVWESGTWKFNLTEKVILMNKTAPSAKSYEYGVVELGASKMILTYQIQGSNSTIYTLTHTFQ